MVLYQLQTSNSVSFIKFYIFQQTTDDELTIANKGCNGFSFWPGWRFEEAVSQLIPAVDKPNR